MVSPRYMSCSILSLNLMLAGVPHTLDFVISHRKEETFIFPTVNLQEILK
jgi:hypothetical protein